MDKQLLHEKILLLLKELHQNVADAALQAHDTATNKETVAENKYDTFGLEASYLAHGQAKRVAEYEEGLLAFNNLRVVQFSRGSVISLGALVLVESETGTQQYLFLGPALGGIQFHFEDKQITLITASAPLGKLLMGCQIGDEVELTLPGQKKSYEIMAIY